MRVRDILRRSAWSLHRVPLFPSDLRLYRLETPWGSVELHISPYARILTTEEEIEQHIGEWNLREQDVRLPH